MNVFIFSEVLRRPLGGLVETVSSEQHWGGFSQLTRCQSAVKQALGSPAAIYPGLVVFQPVHPILHSPQLWAAPPKGAYHSWAGASEAVAKVVEPLPQQQLSSAAQGPGGSRGDEGTQLASMHDRAT